MSYGFKTFKRMRRRCLLSLGYLRIIKRDMVISTRIAVQNPHLLDYLHSHATEAASHQFGVAQSGTNRSTHPS